MATRLHLDQLDVVSFDTLLDPATPRAEILTQHQQVRTNGPTAATLCEFCASDSGCW